MSREDQFQGIVTKDKTIRSRERCYEEEKVKYGSHGKLETSKSMRSSGTYKRERGGGGTWKAGTCLQTQKN